MGDSIAIKSLSRSHYNIGNSLLPFFLLGKLISKFLILVSQIVLKLVQ